ncbi:hypothetical protein [Arthrobacter sp. AL12]|uniref:hypothetical protein n=1 Tax=Arthrobacter sp. AL12 TaxID=3042241 RepID=UPI00249BE2C7|nr:hypothetical protein [Arthrobacter sp. AL12]MDI3213583.1 hypothetical protein [Arthrobacter sp. AL12]
MPATVPPLNGHSPWAIVMAILWLASAALSIDEAGNRSGKAAWVAMATPLLFIGAAVYYQNRLERLGEDAPPVPDGDTGQDYTGGGRV